MKILRQLGLAASAMLMMGACWANPANNAPINLVVPFNAGGPSDAVARVTAKSLSEELRRPMVVDNKPGATGMIGARFVARARPDGLTLLAGTKSALISGPLLNTSTKIDATADFLPINFIAQDDLIFLASTSTPFNTVNEFIQYAKKNPKLITYGTSGLGSSYHFDTELIASLVNVELMHVPYGGAAPAFQDLLAGRIDIQLQTFSQARPYLNTGRVKVLAVISRARLPELPNVPTFFENSDLKPFDAAVWTGLFAPKGTPKDALDELRRAMHKLKASPEFQKALDSQGLRMVSKDPAEISRQIQSETSIWKALIKAGRVSLN